MLWHTRLLLLLFPCRQSPGIYLVSPVCMYALRLSAHQVPGIIYTHIRVNGVAVVDRRGINVCVYYYYFSCHPTMCSMIFDMDHSYLSRKKKPSETKGNVYYWYYYIPGMLLASSKYMFDLPSAVNVQGIMYSFRMTGHSSIRIAPPSSAMCNTNSINSMSY